MTILAVFKYTERAELQLVEWYLDSLAGRAAAHATAVAIGGFVLQFSTAVV